MPDRIDSLSDEQLLEACRLLPWEKRVKDFTWSVTGCLTTLAVAGVVVFMCHLILRRVTVNHTYWILLAPLGLVMAGLIFFRLDFLVERRRKRYWRELQRRYAGASLKTYVEEAETDSETGRDGGADVVVILEVAALPRGGDWLVRVRLSPGGGIVEARKLKPAFLYGDEVERVELAMAQAPLSAEECEKVREMAAAPFGTDEEAFVPSMVIDGTPATVAVWERGRGVVKTGGCNLAGVPHDKNHYPAVRLMRLMIELAQKVPMPPVVYGSCNWATGDVRIDAI